MTILTIGVIVFIILLTIGYFYSDYIKRKRKAYSLKIDDKVRIFDREDKFEYATIIGFHFKDNKKIAICKFENDNREEFDVMDLIY